MLTSAVSGDAFVRTLVPPNMFVFDMLVVLWNSINNRKWSLSTGTVLLHVAARNKRALTVLRLQVAKLTTFNAIMIFASPSSQILLRSRRC